MTPANSTRRVGVKEQAMTDHEWMRELCDRDDGSDITRKPWTIEIDGELWDVATNGWAIVVVRGESFDAAPIKVAGGLRSVLSPPTPHRFNVTAAALRKWLDLAPSARTPCATCESGELKSFTCRRCNGQGEVECYACGHDDECGNCDGAGTDDICPDCAGEKFVRAKDENGVVAGIGVNIRIANQYLGRLPLDGVSVLVDKHDDHKPVVFEGDGWRALIMPRLDGGGPELPLTEVETVGPSPTGGRAE